MQSDLASAACSIKTMPSGKHCREYQKEFMLKTQENNTVTFLNKRFLNILHRIYTVFSL